MFSMAVTVNVGGGPGGSATRVEGMSRWAERCILRQNPSVVFAQEVPGDEWLAIWGDAGYTITDGVEPRWRIRSALITRHDLDVTQVTQSNCASLEYHGSYLAVARWNNAQCGAVILASVHASPNHAEPARYGWAGDLPAARAGNDSRWTGNRLWDSDMVLGTLGSLTKDRMAPGGVLAAGDFNEARRSDFDAQGARLGTWGQEYFAEVDRIGFTDVTFEALQDEIPTRDGLQLDHVFVHGAVASLIDRRWEPVTDEWWAGPGDLVLSDHAPVWFFIDA